jgi:hypothetical protein
MKTVVIAAAIISEPDSGKIVTIIKQKKKGSKWKKL